MKSFIITLICLLLVPIAVTWGQSPNQVAPPASVTVAYDFRTADILTGVQGTVWRMVNTSADGTVKSIIYQRLGAVWSQNWDDAAGPITTIAGHKPLGSNFSLGLAGTLGSIFLTEAGDPKWLSLGLEAIWCPTTDIRAVLGGQQATGDNVAQGAVVYLTLELDLL